MNMNKEILNKIRVISTSPDSRSNFVWPDECWVVGASNSNFGSDTFEVHYLYKPKWSTQLAGINIVMINEAYTSKCSFLDREKISKHGIYAGRRIKRGLFISSSGIIINADVNGSLNIMRLGLKRQNVKLDVVEKILRPENKRFVLNPVRICA